MKYILTIICMLTQLSCTQNMEVSASATTVAPAAIDYTSCGLIRNEKQKEIHWNQFPVHFVIEQSIPAEFHNSIREAAQEWNKTLGFNAIEIDSNLVATNLLFNNMNIIYWVTDANVLKPEQEAVTYTTWMGNVTQSANILINSPRFQFSVEDVDYTKVDMTSLMIHEFGHALNLAHSDEGHSVMNPTLANGQIRQHISELDRAAVLCGVARKDPVTGTQMASLGQ